MIIDGGIDHPSLTISTITLAEQEAKGEGRYDL